MAVFVILSWFAVNAEGQVPDQRPSKWVLVLYLDERLLPAEIIVDQAINTVFTEDKNKRIELHSEFLDVARFPDEAERQRQRNFFREKYRERPPDLTIAVGGSAFDFLAERRDGLFAEVPIVYCSVAGDPHPEHLSDSRIADIPVRSKNSNVLKTRPKLRTLWMLRDCKTPASASVGGARAVGNDRAADSVSVGHGPYI